MSGWRSLARWRLSRLLLPISKLGQRSEGEGELEDPIPFTYKDYFGPGNSSPGFVVTVRCDLPLQLVRREIVAGIQKTLVQAC